MASPAIAAPSGAAIPEPGARASSAYPPPASTAETSRTRGCPVRSTIRPSTGPPTAAEIA